MPAAAVIPAPRAYQKVVAIKTLVVGLLEEIFDGPACKSGTVGSFLVSKRAPVSLT